LRSEESKQRPNPHFHQLYAKYSSTVYSTITGIILSGGKNSRMGVNKSLLKIGDRTVIEIIVDLMQSLFSELILSTNSGEEYSFLRLTSVADIYKDAGPLAGIHAGLQRSTTKDNVIISCDQPLMNREMLEYFATAPSNKSVVISRVAGFTQPLPGRYAKDILPAIEKILATASNHKSKSLYSLYTQVDAEITDPSHLPFYRDELFFNMNNQKDYEKISVCAKNRIPSAHFACDSVQV
jgi:molybdenum cofactor guanylyltransferase